jgi:hypothetical protein
VHTPTGGLGMLDEPMKPEDFFHVSSGNNVPLLDEVGRPIVGLPRSLCGLAEVAASIYGHASELPEDHLEQAIQWLKALKAKDRTSARLTYEFLDVLDELRNSSEQIDLQRRGHRKLWLAKGISALLALVLASAVGLAIAHNWFGLGVALLVSLALFFAGERGTVSAIRLFKEQEQRYLWASIRQAGSVSEINQAGIFAYLHGTTFGAPGFSEEGSRAAIRAERERLTDALYADPDDYLVS